MSSPIRYAIASLSLLTCFNLHAEYRQLAWADLIPEGAQTVIPQPIALHDLDDLAQVLSEDGPAATQLEPAAPVVDALDGVTVRLPGYMTPLHIDEEGRIAEFLFVPYYGACIHVPPPPSNQIVHVRSELGAREADIYQPFWIEGTLRVEPSSSSLASAGYQMQANKIYPYYP